MSSVLVVQHEDECAPALLGDWLAEAGVTLDVRRPYAGDPLPEPGELTSWGGLLVLGGPMGADDDETYAWLGPVKELVRAAAAQTVATLGVCLGHQLVAVALGGAVGPDPAGQQLGLLDVGWTDEAATDALFATLTTPRRGVHWNDDVVTALPDGATVLAVAPGGEIQVVRYAPAVWGVQLHPEVDAHVVATWATADAERHLARGVDQSALIGAIADASRELEAAWRPLADAFALQVRE